MYMYLQIERVQNNTSKLLFFSHSKDKDSVVVCVSLMLVIFHRRLLAAVENIAYPGICSSPERCILAFLFDLYSSCAHLRVRIVTKTSNTVMVLARWD